MEQDVTMVVPRDLPAVFAYFADAAGISSWTHLHDGAGVDPGEIIGYEPPRSVAYRVTTAAGTHVLRIWCIADEVGATRVHLSQTGDDGLTIDLSALQRTLGQPAASAPARAPEPDPK